MFAFKRMEDKNACRILNELLRYELSTKMSK